VRLPLPQGRRHAHRRRQAFSNNKQATKAGSKGYCSKSLGDTRALNNQAVCKPGGSAKNIAFHIRTPFRVNKAGQYHFRNHVDFRRGGWIGVDRPKFRAGNLWGFQSDYAVQLEVGDHLLEAIGYSRIPLLLQIPYVSDPSCSSVSNYSFEECCDGCAYIEIVLPCDVRSKSKKCTNKAASGCAGSGSKTNCGNWRVITSGASSEMSCN